jgi:cell fate regulator YaaT (PSP1 superfamily)
MGCNGCTQGVNGLPEGCRSSGVCSTDGGNKLTVFNWLSDMKIPTDQETFDVVEVRFKNSRKGFFRNVNNLKLNIGDAIAVEASPGHDIGVISLVGELVKVQMKSKNVGLNDESLLKVYRKATQRDIDIWKSAREREWETMMNSRKIAGRIGLKMKISDIEYQGDNSKAIFYYTAEERVDFRILIKELASTFSVRIEMKQIGLRQEAARLGGIGSCGRELCCTTWLTDFRSVTTTAARYQQLSLNPQKLAGQCGKLKCCLNFELDSYMDALKDFPPTETMLQTERGRAFFQKMDIFRGVVWYSYQEEPMNWHPIPVSCANDIIELNKNGTKVATLEEYTEEVVPTKKVEFIKVVGQDDLNRFDVKKENSKRKNFNKKRRRIDSRSDNRNANTNKKESGQTQQKEIKNKPQAKQQSKRPNRVKADSSAGENKVNQQHEKGSDKNLAEGQKQVPSKNKPRFNKNRRFNKKHGDSKDNTETKKDN